MVHISRTWASIASSASETAIRSRDLILDHVIYSMNILRLPII